MSLKMKGLLPAEFIVDELDCIRTIKQSLGFNDECFIENNIIYELVDIGHHNSEYEKRIKNKDFMMVKLFEAILTLEKYYSHLISKEDWS